MTRVVVVDDHRLVRAGLVALLDADRDIEVVGEAEDGQRAIELVTTVVPDVVLMDLSMPVLDGIAATRAIAQRHPDIAIVALTSFTDTARVGDALGAGAVGYLLKDSDPRDLLAGVRAAANGHAPVDPRVARALLPGATRGGLPGDGLSAREREVLQLVAKGLANKQIGRSLGITERTVKAHLGRVFRQLGVSDRTSAALWAKENL